MKSQQRVVVIGPQKGEVRAPLASVRTGDAIRRCAESFDSIEEGLTFLRSLPEQWEFLADRIADRIADTLAEVLTKRLYSIDEVATQIGVCRRTVENILAREDCPLETVSVGTRKLVTRDSLERFCKVSGGAEHGVSGE